MAAEPHDPKTLWQEQEPEISPVTLDYIHTVSRNLDRKTRYTPAIVALALIAVGVLASLLWRDAHSALARATTILFVAGQLGCYYLIYRMGFTSRDPAEPASAHLRRRLVRSLSYLTGGVAVALLPLAPFVLVSGYRVLALRPGPLWPRVLPFVILAALLVFVFARASLGARRTRAQLRELDELLKR
jgi:hypothetical protein